jgi:hypothetical protein
MATVLVLRVLFLVAGVVCLYVAFFLREDEEARLQNRLETWWITVDDAKIASLSRHAVLMRYVAKCTGSAIGRVFGERLMGLRAAGAAIWCSVSATCIVVLVLVVLHWFVGGGTVAFMAYPIHDIAKGEIRWYSVGPVISGPAAGPFIILLVLVLACVFGWLGLAPAFVRRKFWLPTWVVAAGAIAAYIYPKLGYYTNTYVNQQQTAASFAPFHPMTKLAIVLLFTVVAAALVAGSIAFLRGTLRTMARLNSAIAISGCAVLHLLLSVCLLSVPFVALVLTSASDNGQESSPGVLATIGFVLLGCLAPANVLPVATSVLYLLAVILLAAHHCLWPVISRPLYALQKSGAVKRPKFIGGIGFALIAFGLRVDVALAQALTGKLL